MKPELRFETMEMPVSDLGAETCVPDLVGSKIWMHSNGTKYCMGMVRALWCQ